MNNKILEGVKYVADNSKFVTINIAAINSLVEHFSEKSTTSWANAAPFTIPKLSNKEKIAFSFILNSVNFSYWPDNETLRWNVEYQGKSHGGFWAMAASLYRSIEENIPLFDPKFLENINENELGSILRGNVEIPLFNERLKIFRELGREINKKYDGDFTKILNNHDVFKTLNNIITTFPSFDDASSYKEREIFFYKRAQLLIFDIYQTFNGEGYGQFDNINQLTAFADYKIPQILRDKGILVYSEELSRKINSKEHVKKGSDEEIEIRANMIWAVELLREEINRKHPSILAADIDNYLWLLSHEKKNITPYHLTRTIAY